MDLQSFEKHPVFQSAGYPAYTAPLATAPSGWALRPRAVVGAGFGTFAWTALGLALFGGAGALIGYVVGGTQKAVLIGAIAGVVTPPLTCSACAAFTPSP